MKPLILSPDAEADVASAFDWYQLRSPRVADRFLVALREAVLRVADAPSAWPLAEHATRRAQVFGFPYALYFRELEDVLVVVAILHGRRGPVHRKVRLGGS